MYFSSFILLLHQLQDSDLQEIEEVELGADTEVDMNTEEDVRLLIVCSQLNKFAVSNLANFANFR